MAAYGSLATNCTNDHSLIKNPYILESNFDLYVYKSERFV